MVGVHVRLPLNGHDPHENSKIAGLQRKVGQKLKRVRAPCPKLARIMVIAIHTSILIPATAMDVAMVDDSGVILWDRESQKVLGIALSVDAMQILNTPRPLAFSSVG